MSHVVDLKGMPTMELPRPKRLVRPTSPPPFRLTDRDVALIQAVARWRFATSEQLIRFVQISEPGASAQQIVRRLQLLFAHAYLDRLANQHVQLQSFSHLVYGIGRAGARLLAELGEAIDPRLAWTRKNSRASNAWLLHTLGITETMLALTAACTARQDARLADGPDLLEHLPESSRGLKDPFRLRVTISDGHKPVPLSVVPDRVFSLLLPNERRFNFCLELDRATMSVLARKLTTKSSFGRKLTAYLAAYAQGRHRAQWGFAGFRVLTVTPSEKRIRSMLAAQAAISGGRLGGMFLYTTPQRLAAQGVFGPIWITSARDDLALLEGA